MPIVDKHDDGRGAIDDKGYLVAILEALKQAGAMKAELVVL